VLISRLEDQKLCMTYTECVCSTDNYQRVLFGLLECDGKKWAIHERLCVEHTVLNTVEAAYYDHFGSRAF
jgi:hypothetical protein